MRTPRVSDDKQKGKFRKFYKDFKRLPTFEEIMNLCNYKSKGAVTGFVEKMIDQKFLTREKGKIVRGKSFFEIKVLGTVEAGFPTIAEEDTTNTVTLDELIIDNKESTYMLSVKGESMKDAGILDGDMVLIERVKTAPPGKIVVAEVDGEYTLKTLRKKEGKLYLEPANKAFKDIYPKRELTIQGIVIAVIRKYS